MADSDGLFGSNSTWKKKKKLSDNAVVNDRWDRADRNRVGNEIAEFAAARKQLGDFAKTGEHAMDDTFFALLKANPRLDDPDNLSPTTQVNHRIMDEAMGLPAMDRLRRYTVNDDVQSAMSCEEMEPVLETLFDKTEAQRKQAEAYEQAIRDFEAAQQEQPDLDELFERWMEDEQLDPEDLQPEEDEDEGDEGEPGEDEGEPGGEGEGEGEGDGPDGTPGGKGKGKGKPGKGQGQPTSGQGGKGKGRPKELSDAQKEQLDKFAEKQRELSERIEQAKAEAEARGESFHEAMGTNRAQIRNLLNKALGEAADNAADAANTALAWGMDPGVLQRLPAAERIALAKRLQNDRLRKIAELFGPMRNLMLAEQQRKTTNQSEEVYDLEMGKDLGRIVPSELLALGDEDTEWDFLRRYSESGVLQYAMQGVEKLAKGGIIMCEDGSGSMSGDREMWSKAVMLCLLDLAKRQKRSFRLIHFGGPGQTKQIDFTRPEHFSMERIIDAAELFYGGGTDFSTPMRKAMKALQEDFKRDGEVKADIVFVTDDECWVDETFMTEYLDEMKRMQATTWGISVAGGGPREGALNTMTDGKVCQIRDLQTGGEIRSIFRSM